MDYVLYTDEMPWKASTADGLKSYELKPNVIGAEYTDAYCADVVRVAPGGSSDLRTDQERHAFFVLSGEGRITVGDQTFRVSAGSVVKIPPGVAHAATNDSDSSLVLLTLHDPPSTRT